MFFQVATGQATIAGVGASFDFSRTADDRPGFLSYIVMMIHGDGFFHSAIDSLKLLLHNPLRTLTVIKVAGFIIANGILASSLLSILYSFITIHPDFIADKEYLSPVHVFYWQLIIFVYFIVAFAVRCF
ncbi:MAG: hypothetical protein EZS28_015399 [Streblomastix strix]|uniref:Choline transporter-like protein n=1 Tax=Streblomastix strix TaxID=222440 RepID=A0A5J4W260_9EUKA|nr:MAG: hypothetical protein EZS28_015399 [Streblomastix strix]